MPERNSERIHFGTIKEAIEPPNLIEVQLNSYLDFLQNARTQTVVSAYSVRPVPGAAVSAPLAWREVRNGLDPASFTIKTMRRRLDRLSDLWKPVLGPGIDLTATLERLSST